MGFGSFDYNDMADAVALRRYNTAQLSRSSEENSISTPSVENLVSTCFSIPRTVTIPSNGVEHKVLVAMVRLHFSFELTQMKLELFKVHAAFSLISRAPSPMSAYLHEARLHTYQL
ncbi:hypothetical protein TELCIR_14336 [Teladorsagia circumcincta]|uniref:Uncharacterized protein n=1 Tax=Teladorsagia circumcincta TaxID=45464 RepID=A0A2G9U194_TELCI|nr:hypothetical protein TELCIR_14336 [Teladorsagia circumcincta]